MGLWVTCRRRVSKRSCKHTHLSMGKAQILHGRCKCTCACSGSRTRLELPIYRASQAPTYPRSHLLPSLVTHTKASSPEQGLSEFQLKLDCAFAAGAHAWNGAPIHGQTASVREPARSPHRPFLAPRPQTKLPLSKDAPNLLVCGTGKHRASRLHSLHW